MDRFTQAGLVACAFLWLLPISAGAQDSPVGRWKTVDDETGKVKSLVVIWEDHGTLSGKVEKLIAPGPNDPVRCDRCQGELKGKPVEGLQILRELRKKGDEWSGKVLDPHSGKTYKCSIRMEDGGRKLKIHGYMGISLLGRSQHWLRDQ